MEIKKIANDDSSLTYVVKLSDINVNHIFHNEQLMYVICGCAVLVKNNVLYLQL